MFFDVDLTFYVVVLSFYVVDLTLPPFFPIERTVLSHTLNGSFSYFPRTFIYVRGNGQTIPVYSMTNNIK